MRGSPAVGMVGRLWGRLGQSWLPPGIDMSVF